MGLNLQLVPLVVRCRGAQVQAVIDGAAVHTDAAVCARVVVKGMVREVTPGEGPLVSALSVYACVQVCVCVSVYVCLCVSLSASCLCVCLCLRLFATVVDGAAVRTDVPYALGSS